MSEEVGGAGRRWPRWEWTVGFLIVVSLISCSRLGKGLPMIVQNAAFLVVISLPLLLTAISWVELKIVWKDESISRWRVWVSFCGCAALSFALVVPIIVVFFTLSWLSWSVWCFSAGLLALFAGIMAARSVRFPLIFGGLIIGSLSFVVPVGVL